MRYPVKAEWVRVPDDALWRRSKLGLRLTRDEVLRVEEALRYLAGTNEPVL